MLNLKKKKKTKNATKNQNRMGENTLMIQSLE